MALQYVKAHRWLLALAAGAATAGFGLFLYRHWRRRQARSRSQPLYMGLDLSTQQLKAIVVDDHLRVVAQAAVRYDTDLPLYGTENGVHHGSGSAVTSPTLMWVEALDLLLQRVKDAMRDAGCQMSSIVCVTGAGQQHGSVYWRNGARQALRSLDPEKLLETQLKSADAFIVHNSPVWMDSSTTEQCNALEKAVGGPQRLAEATGSKAYERFTGSQISKIFQEQRSAYDQCERVSLVSSFLCSLFLADYAPIDYSDGSGMNLLDIRPWPREWWRPAVECCGADLGDKLGEPVSSDQLVGRVAEYYVRRHGFSSDCQVAAFTGDNPSSLAGFSLQPGDVVISLGTSDTLFLWLSEARPALVGHIFVNPVDPHAYMALLCYKNGDITRRSVRDQCVTEPAKSEDQRWDIFTRMLKSTPRGNNGNIGIYFRDVEIVPFAQGECRFNAADSAVDSFEAAVEVRALIEGQIMAKRVHAESLGYHVGPGTRVLATGGASNNPQILQIMADIFNTSVFTLDVSESACLGAAYRAKYCYARSQPSGSRLSFTDVIGRDGARMTRAATPSSGAAATYEPLLKRYQKLEDQVAQTCRPQ